MKIEHIAQSTDILNRIFPHESEDFVPPFKMSNRSRSVDLIEVVVKGREDRVENEDGYVDFLDAKSWFVVSGPVTETRVGLYQGVVCGYDTRENSVEVLYINMDGDIWFDTLQKDDGTFYKWDIVQKG